MVTRLIQPIKYISIWCSLCIILASCGFHLRGISGDYKFPFKRVYIECDSTVICYNFKNAIKTQTLAQLITNPESADATIRIFNEETSREPQTFNAAGRIASYMLTYQVDAQIIKNHEVIANDMHIAASSPMNYSDSQILSANQNETDIWNMLHQNATNQLIRRIVYFK